MSETSTELVPVTGDFAPDVPPAPPGGAIAIKNEIEVRESPLANLKLDLVDSIDQAMAFKRWLGERRDTPVGLDTETTGLDPSRDSLRLVQFGDLSHGWAIPWPLWGGVAMEAMRTYEGRWVMHNRPFDCRFLAQHADWDVPWDLIDDTMVIGALVNPLESKALKTMATKHVDQNATRGEKLLHDGMKKQGWTWATVPYSFAPYWVYGALDPVLTAALWKWGHARVVQSCPEAYELELGTQRVCANMMTNGLLVDVDYVRDESVKLERFSGEARAWLAARHGITSPMSAAQIGKALEALGVRITQFTPTNQPKMTKEILEDYQNNHPDILVRDLARYVLAVRHADKIRGTYLDNFLDMIDANGRLHASINTLGARTSRMTMSDPNLQNLPRDDKVVRGAFIPEQGYALVSCDLDQIEARLTAHFSRDPGLIKAFLDADQFGTDFFCGVASGIFGETIIKGDPRRQLTKNVVYGSIYGAGPATMARTAGVPIEQMAPVKFMFDAAYPGISMLNLAVIEASRAYDPPCVFTPLGRRLVADHERAFTQLLNALIQGHAAEYLKMRLLDLDAAGLGPYLRLPIHDEVIAEVPRKDADELMREIERIMSDRDNYRVPITAGGKVMTERWQK